ncbi:OsmC family protein [Kribbella solani]|uniref:Putative redox protein n=1 Tax=Kribbella solani TaxID=236067 RepID=A0A841DRT7_9ACTN|nr:OsmC family protein [Kribbella solani]MBB5978098.1 putative redox protein [Kribbella solani]
MVEAVALTEPWQVRFRASGNEGVADTRKNGVGGTAGLRPHELLEAAFASCLTISARMYLTELGIDDHVTVSVDLGREETVTRFRYQVELGPAAEAHRDAVLARLEASPVRKTLTKTLVFEAATSGR